MRCCVSYATCLLVLWLVAGCNDSAQAPADAARKAAEEHAAKLKAEKEQALREQERRAAENRLREELKRDFELLLGHWDHPGAKGADGKPLLSLHLEITTKQVARFRMISGVSDSSTECPIRLTSKDGQHVLVQGDGPSKLQMQPLAYHLEGDTLTLTGSATDVLLKEVDFSGEWRRTDWTKRTEAEIADLLKTLDAQLVYDESNPAKPIVQVTFTYQAPIHNVNLRLLVGLKQLQELDLSAATNLSDASIKYLLPLKQLKQLNLTGLSLSNEAVQELARALPNCHIIR